MVHVVRTWTNDLIFKGMRYVAHTWQLNLSGHSLLANPWRLTNLLLSLNYFKTRPLKLNSTYSFFFIQAGFMSSITFIFSFLSLFLYLALTIDYQLQNIIQYGGENNIAQRKMSKNKEGSTAVTENKTVMAFLLGKLAPLFYRAHSFASFLGEIQ